MTKLSDTVAGARLLGQRMIRSSKAANPEGRMPLLDHIRELRSRLVKAVLAIIVVMGVALVFFDPIWKIVERPFCRAVIGGQTGCVHVGHQLVVNEIFASFTLRIQVAFMVGLVVASPIWLYQIWAFIAPGLYSKERRYTYAFLGAAVPLFLAGAVSAYFAMSRGLRFLLGLTPGGVLNLPTVGTYLGYFQAMILGFGLSLELPLLLVVLNRVRVLTHERFARWRRMMIFLVFVFAGMATPSPDPSTMLMLAAPCVVLVEVAELIIWRYDKKLAARPGLYPELADDELAPIEEVPLEDQDATRGASLEQGAEPRG